MTRAPARPAPWPADAGGNGTERAFVELDTKACTNAVVRWSEEPRVARPTGITSDLGLELWELPADVPAHDSELEIQTRNGINRVRTYLSDQSQAPTPASHDQGDAWERLLGFHMERITAWMEEAGRQAKAIQSEGKTLVPWVRFDEDYWRNADSTKEPPRHLIVRIAEECSAWVVDLCERPRQVLRRVRRQLPLAQAQDIDDACIRWLTRQPGRTTAERAGPRQRILAVARDDTVDTPENRVLRDFLRLSTEAAGRYIRTYKGKFADSKRVASVSRYADTVLRLLRQSPIASVPSLVGEPARNYVLQFDVRYARMWSYYDRLRRQEEERDNLLGWRHRVWTEFCELLVRKQAELVLGPHHTAAGADSPRKGQHVGPAVIHREASFGHFLDVRTFAGLWPVAGSSTQTCITMHRTGDLVDHPTRSVQQLAPLLPDLVMTKGPAFDRQNATHVLGIWGLFAPMDSDAEARAQATRLQAALQTHAANGVRGLLLLPTTETNPGGADLGTGRVGCFRVRLPDQVIAPSSVGAAIGTFLRGALA